LTPRGFIPATPPAFLVIRGTWIGAAIPIPQIVATERLALNVPGKQVRIVNALPVAQHIDLGCAVAWKKVAMQNAVELIVLLKRCVAIAERIIKDISWMRSSGRRQADGRKANDNPEFLHGAISANKALRSSERRQIFVAEHVTGNDGVLMMSVPAICGPDEDCKQANSEGLNRNHRR
jgi:hypothetical protein